MRPLVTAAEVRQLEALAEERFGTSASVLMERAGVALAEVAAARLGADGTAFVVCGSGNNGGDGFVAARCLVALGRRVRVQLGGGGEPKTADARKNAEALAELGVLVEPRCDLGRAGKGDVVIDALFGTGLSRAVEGAAAEAISQMVQARRPGARAREGAGMAAGFGGELREGAGGAGFGGELREGAGGAGAGGELREGAGAIIVAADIPSGVFSDTGQTRGPCVRADVTVTFGVRKPAQALAPGASLFGEIQLVDIGLPPLESSGLAPISLFELEESDARAALPRRETDSHKGTYGHVLVVAGSVGKTGAAALAAKSALKSGAGLVSVATRREVLGAVLVHAPELMGSPLEGEGALGLPDLPALLSAAERKQALVVGPGIPRGPETAALLAALLQQLEVPCVLDADALNALSDSPDALTKARAARVLTPHPAELARLLHCTTADVQTDRLGSARTAAAKFRAVVVLKGAGTVIATPDGRAFVNPTGNAGMATAGTGDVLAGVIGALLAQGLTPESAACTGVFAHGLAGDLAARVTGQLGLTASDVIDGLLSVWRRWER